MSNLIHLRIKQVDADESLIEIGENASVLELKEIIFRVLHIPVAEQRLIHHGRVLQDEKRIVEYGIEDQRVLHLVKRPPPASQPPPSTASSESNASGPSGSSRFSFTDFPNGSSMMTSIHYDGGNLDPAAIGQIVGSITGAIHQAVHSGVSPTVPTNGRFQTGRNNTMQLLSGINDELQDLMEQLAHLPANISTESAAPAANSSQFPQIEQLSGTLSNLDQFLSQVMVLSSQVRRAMQTAMESRGTLVDISLFATCLRRLSAILNLVVSLLERLQARSSSDLPQTVFIPLSTTLPTAHRAPTADSNWQSANIILYYLSKLPNTTLLPNLLDLKDVSMLASIRIADVLEVVEKRERGIVGLKKVQEVINSWVDSVLIGSFEENLQTLSNLMARKIFNIGFYDAEWNSFIASTLQDVLRSSYRDAPTQFYLVCVEQLKRIGENQNFVANNIDQIVSTGTSVLQPLFSQIFLANLGMNPSLAVSSQKRSREQEAGAPSKSSV